ncbi:MBL fold metallo-hydrolase [Arcicella rosea]|uniref:L-ascorbate metabolism protein UlaG (Beta-lactamase superfamily) n=1 Tax=Arcicella rosea TaxID=502909 RepID=A0A841EQI7_9BACT|nr:MBL fold metallo-hydrolase [Arcicella rosea]MBB6003273.1 L-ascorbate metabolism protein UlaG (beta-lactamase superfamily) [Arcicella rosea]
MLTIIIIVAFIGIGTYTFMQQKVFGVNPSGSRLARIEKSPNYKDGSFQNLSVTEVMPKDASYWGLLKDFLNKPKTVEPAQAIPSIKTDLKNLKAEKPTIVWFGHSSYLIKSKSVNVLVDPVFSGAASPISFFGKAFNGTDAYEVEDFPNIDILILSHDHYDHLDYLTISKLLPKVKKFYTALGVGAHLEHWGVKPENIVELDWWESQKITDNLIITSTPARHFSGRGFTRGKTLWSSFVLNIDGYNIFIGGDSGYDYHFKTIGEKFGPFDIALLENGQYGKDWPLIHTTPEETAKVAEELKTKVLMPVHWAKFVLGYHPWNEPINRLTKSLAKTDIKLTTPMIGEPVVLDSIYPQKVWWNFE